MTRDEPWNQPAPWIAFLRKHIWLIGAVLLLLMITVMRPLLIRRPPPPEITGEVPTFTLVDQTGASFSREDMLEHDKVWVIGFVFTRCATTCPAVSRAMIDFQDQLERSKLADRVELLSVSVDPKHDTPTVLADYAESIGADWRFVTGSEAEIQHFVVDGFKLAVGESFEKEPGVIDIAHSTKLALVDRWGHVRGYYSTDPEGLNELYHRTLGVIRLEEDEG
jgi:cytochrome oxidase Cu insertion factor (SCO1/SenC/PrrC family)